MIKCDMCGEKSRKISFTLRASRKEVNFCKECFKELTEKCINMCEKENIVYDKGEENDEREND